MAGSRVAHTFTSLALRPPSPCFSAVWLESLSRRPRFGFEWREGTRVSGIGCSWNHGCGRTSELPGRRDERAGGPYPLPGRGRGSQDQSPLFYLLSSQSRAQAPSLLVPPKSEPLTSLPLENLLGSFILFLLKARAPSPLQPGLLALPLGLVPFNSSEGPRPSSQPPSSAFSCPTH